MFFAGNLNSFVMSLEAVAPRFVPGKSEPSAALTPLRALCLLWGGGRGIKQTPIRQGIPRSTENDLPSHQDTPVFDVKKSTCSKELWQLRIPLTSFALLWFCFFIIIIFIGLICLTQGSGVFFLARHPNPSVDSALNILIKEAAAFYGLLAAWNIFSQLLKAAALPISTLSIYFLFYQCQTAPLQHRQETLGFTK